jgi:CubicO group peptidase (beta-lactamase class C family)
VKRQNLFFSLSRLLLPTMLTIGAIGAAALAPSWADTPGHPQTKATMALSQVLSRAVDRHDTPGVVGLVVDRNGVVFEGAAGKADVARNLTLSPDAIFFIASMTRPR